MDAMSSGNESDAEPMSMEMLEDIRKGSQCHPGINRIEARYKLRDHIKQGQLEWKITLLSTINMSKCYTRYLRLWLMRFRKIDQFWVNLAHKFFTSFHSLETFQK